MSGTNSYAAVLFDLDGTLIDTAPDFASVLNRMLEAEGRTPLAYDTVRQAVSQGSATVVSLGFPDLSRDSAEFAEKRAQFLTQYRAHLADESRLFDGLDALLKDLEAREIPWGIVTNKPSLYAFPLLEQLNLDKRCAVTICPDMVTKTKPDAEPMLKACAAIGVDASRCIYVGDHIRDIQAGAASNMKTVAAGWGYIPEHENINDWNADFNCATVADLHHLLSS